MKRLRLRRFLRRILFAASLLVMLLSIAGWIRSRWWTGDQCIRFSSFDDGVNQTVRGLGFAHGGGDCAFFWMVERSPRSSQRAVVARSLRWVHVPLPTRPIRYDVGGRIYGLAQYGVALQEVSEPNLAGKLRLIVLPYWLIVFGSALAPAWSLIGYKRRRAARRLAAGCCIHCGYDLRGSPDRCPECGAIRALC